MPITTVFLDLYQTLAHFHPSRETRQDQVLREFGFQVDFKKICWAYLQADHYYTLMGQEQPIHLRTPEDRERIYLHFQRLLLEKMGLDEALPLTEEIRRRYSELDRHFRLFPDAVPAVRQIAEAGYRIGLITNVTDDPTEMLEEAGLKEPFAAITASCVTGCEKPDPRIFLAALAALSASPEESVHVGDQMLADVEGARGAGLNAVLLDRCDVQDGVYSPRITTLLDLVPLLPTLARERESEGARE